jgi:hypothetical protein
VIMPEVGSIDEGFWLNRFFYLTARRSSLA